MSETLVRFYVAPIQFQLGDYMQHKFSLVHVSRMLALAATLVLVNAALILAQLSTAKVEGIVRDKDTGKPLQGAQVTVEGTRLGNVTNADGYYFILNVPPGRHSITFTFTGYQKTTIADQLLLAGQTATVNGNLSGTVVELQGITVEGESEVLVPRDNTVTKQRMTASEITETPVTKLEDLMVLQAGVQTGGRDAESRGLRIRGGRLGEEGMVVDGMMVRNYTANPFTSGQGWIFETEIGSQGEDTTPLEFSADAVEQVDIITGGFQAEYGNAQSGIINIVTKEGGPDYRGSLRYTTDQQNPRTSDWGYNQIQASIGGPVPLIKNMYFHGSSEIQGFADRTATHADEGFRGVNQEFVDRLNDAVRNDPVLGERVSPYTLEMLQTGRNFYASKTGASASLFSPKNPVRLPGNWQDRTLASGKLTYSPISGLKFIATNSWSRVQQSYPNGYEAEGDYFQTGIVDTETDFYKNYTEVYWSLSPYWNKGFTSIYVPQSYGRRDRTNNLLLGGDWDFWRSAERSATLQLRFSKMDAQDINTSSLKTNWERDTFMSWSLHDVQFEVETWPNKEGLYTDELKRAYLPDGNTGWKQYVPYEGPFAIESGTFYYMNYGHLSEHQNNYKADLDLQINRRNRGKIGFQFTSIDNNSFRTNYTTEKRDPRNEFNYKPEIYAVYAQNRTDLGDFVFDYGLRYDGFQHNTNWGITSLDPWGEHVDPRTLYEWSPRFDVAFPVTDKSQLRFSYGAFTQLPSLDMMYAGSSGGSPFMNPGGLEFSRTDAFEAGLSYLVTNDMALDLVAFYRDVDGNVATKAYFRDYYAWHRGERIRSWEQGYVNRDNGNIKGIDLTLRRRFANNFSYTLMYTLQFSRTTGSSYNSSQGVGDFDATSNELFVPPDELRPIDGDRSHKMSAQFNYMVPEDFKAGTIYNKILGNVKAYAAFQLLSGEPLLNRGGTAYTGSEDPTLTGRWGGYNFFRGRWYTNLDTRFSKEFKLGGARRVSVFGEVYNVLNRRNNRAYPSGYSYEGNSHVTGGVDLKWDQMTDSDQARIRFNADFNGDGILTVEEAALGNIAESFVFSTMDKRLWGTARQIRMGIDFSF